MATRTTCTCVYQIYNHLALRAMALMLSDYTCKSDIALLSMLYLLPQYFLVYTFCSCIVHVGL